jgi:hypothetical protein
MAPPGPFPLFSLPEGLLDNVVGFLDHQWDLAAARAACQALRAAAGRRARRLVFSPLSLCESGGDDRVQVGRGQLRRGRRLRETGEGGGKGFCTTLLLPSTPPTAAAKGDQSPAPPHPCSQERRPTPFQLFPNAREVVLKACDEVLGIFRLPNTPADAAAARAALAGVTRLEASDGLLEPAQLAAALLHLPGLRAVSLTGTDCDAGWRADAFGRDLVVALAGCPRLESLEWSLEDWESGASNQAGMNGAWGPVSL